MNLNIGNILDHFFQKQTLEEVDVRDIRELTDKYPYYAPAQYLLAKKYQQLQHSEYSTQIKKTALYFTNPHWLDLLLHLNESSDADEIFYEREEQVTEGIEEKAFAATDETTQSNSSVVDVIEENVVADEPLVVVETGSVDIASGESEPFIELVEEDVAKGIEEKEFAATDDTIQNDSIVVDGFDEKVVVDEPKAVIETGSIDIPAVESEPVGEIVEEGAMPDTTKLESDNTELEKAEPVAALELTDGISDEEEHEEDKYGDAGLTNEIKLPTGDFSLAEAKAAFTQPLPEAVAGSDIIPIEPLHTVDYFASQGIKFGNELEGKDRLSLRLKSFTEWLKTMKKIHPERLSAEGLDSNTQSSIQNMAETSNEQKDVVTEAMAEVYARQGLHKKAIETYQKLSLLNPDKRVYFAAKISKLNEN